MCELGELGELVKEGGPAVLSCKAHMPYEGCWWEINYWLLKEGGVFPLYVSGRAYQFVGLAGLPRVDDVLYHRTPAGEFARLMEASGMYDDWESHELDEIDPNPNVLNSMTVILERHGLPGPIWTCDVCGKQYRGTAKFLGHTGNGGVGIILTDPCCDDCFSEMRWCSRCQCQVVLEEDGTCPSFGCTDLDDDEEPGTLTPLDEYEDNVVHSMNLYDGSRFLLDEGGELPPSVLVFPEGEQDGEKDE